MLEELEPNKPQGVARYTDLITHVADRAGHDVRYAIDARKIERELGWKPQETFETGIRKTVQWYLNNREWCNQHFRWFVSIRTFRNKSVNIFRLLKI